MDINSNLFDFKPENSSIIANSTDKKIPYTRGIGAREVSKPNFIAKFFFAYYQHPTASGDTYFKINKNDMAATLHIDKKQIKNGILNQKAMEVLLISNPEYQQLLAKKEKKSKKLAEEKAVHRRRVEQNFEAAVRSSEIVSSPAVEEVKQIKKREVEQSLSNFFSKVPPAPGNGEIVVAGAVMCDGQGDYYHMRTQARVLEKQYPDRNVRIIALAEQNLEETVKLIPPKGKKDTIIAYGDNYLGFPEEVASEAHDAINNASLVVSGPISLDLSSGAFNAIDTQKIQNNAIRVSEYDWQAPRNYTDYAKSLAVGLSASGFGMFKPTAKEYEWSMLESENLRRILFENDKKPGTDTNVFFAYTGPEVTTKFIHHAVALSNSDKRDMIIVSPSRTHVSVEDIEDYKEHWKNLGVGSVVIKDGIGDGETIKLSDHGKLLTIVNSGSIPSKDFKILTKLSGPLMACTGDKSVEKALLYGKVPMYDVRRHKQAFYAGLLNEIKAELGPESYLYKYCSKQGYFSGPEAEEVNRILVDHSEELITEAAAFGPKLLETRSANATLLALANMQLYLNEYPELKELEQSCQNEYLNGEISLDDVQAKFREKMIQLKLPSSFS